jgi:hypothetical protein
MPIRADADDLIAFLDSLAKIDPAAMGRLIAARTPCNDALANHPTVQAGTAGDIRLLQPGFFKGQLPDDAPVVGMLGVLNGYLGTLEDGAGKGCGPITAVVELNGDVSGFYRTAETA